MRAENWTQKRDYVREIVTVKGTAMSKQRRVYTAEFKLDTVLEGLRGEKPVAQICRERSIKDTLYYKWREQFQRRASEIFADSGRPQVDEAKEAQIAELERAVGRLTLENEALKKAQRWSSARSPRNGSSSLS